MCTRTARHDLDGGLTLLRSLDQVPELPAHHANAADDAMDDGFVDHGPQPRPVFAGQATTGSRLRIEAAPASRPM